MGHGQAKTEWMILGAGGFIGGHLVRRLVVDYEVSPSSIVCVDRKRLADWWQTTEGTVQEYSVDAALVREVEYLLHKYRPRRVVNLSSDMGGMGFIQSHQYECMRSVRINMNLVQECLACSQVEKYLFASSACVYPIHLNKAFREDDAWPANPEPGYGLEKLFSEKLVEAARDRSARDGLDQQYKIVRFHNVFGPYGSWCDGREKAPAALSRKIAEAIRDRRDSFEVWGDGTAERTFLYVSDAIAGIMTLMAHDHLHGPYNVGSEHVVTIKMLVDMLLTIAGPRARMVVPIYKPDGGPIGVRGRASDNTNVVRDLGWSPTTTLESGLVKTYGWIEQQVNAQGG